MVGPLTRPAVGLTSWLARPAVLNSCQKASLGCLTVYLPRRVAGLSRRNAPLTRLTGRTIHPATALPFTSAQVGRGPPQRAGQQPYGPDSSQLTTMTSAAIPAATGSTTSCVTAATATSSPQSPGRTHRPHQDRDTAVAQAAVCRPGGGPPTGGLWRLVAGGRGAFGGARAPVRGLWRGGGRG